MAFTLAEAKELSQDKLTGWVIDEFRRSPLMEMMIWDDIIKPQGGESFTYAYNRITTKATAGGRALNTEFVPQHAATTQQYATAKVFGGSFNIDRAIAAHERQVLDLVDFQLQQKTQAAVAQFNDWFITGDSGVDPLAFDGIDKAVTGTSTERIPGTLIDLSSAAALDTNWPALLYEIRQTIALMDMAPTLIAVSRQMFAAFQSVADQSAQFTMTRDNMGNEVVRYGTASIIEMGDKPGTSDPIIETDASGQTSIYLMRIGLDGVHAITPDGVTEPKVYLPDMTSPGAVKLGEVEMTAAAVIKSSRSAAVLRNIQIAA